MYRSRCAVEIEREQIANRVVVFRAVETLDRVAPARVRAGRPGAVDFVFERGCDTTIGGRIGARTSGRRHRAGPKLLDHPLPHLRVGAWLRDVRAVESKSGGTEFLVVARDAIGIQERPGIGTRGRSLSAQEG